MMNDPIIDEVRRAREAYAARFNFDLAAMCEDLRRRTEEAARAGRAVLSPVPIPPEPRAVPTKKAG